MSKLHEMIWAEKYRPQTIEDCILPKATKLRFQEFISNKSVPNLLLAGSQGTGKSTVALALCEQLDYEVMMINGSNEGRLLDTVRSMVVPFCSGKSFDNKRKAVIFDEFDHSTPDVMASLRQISDNFSNCTFIYTANFPGRIIDPIKSRCSTIEFVIPSDERKEMMLGIAKRVFQILKDEQISFDKQAVVDLIKGHFPDFRRILNECQAASATGELNASTINLGASRDMEELASILASMNWNNMRAWVATQANLDLAQISRALYQKPDLFTKDSLPQFVLSTAEYQYKNAFVVDKEINCVAYLTTLMTQCEFQNATK
jgi:DNA polymerase III delta prime subunit